MQPVAQVEPSPVVGPGEREKGGHVAVFEVDLAGGERVDAPGFEKLEKRRDAGRGVVRASQRKVEPGERRQHRRLFVPQPRRGERYLTFVTNFSLPRRAARTAQNSDFCGERERIAKTLAT